DVDQVTAALPLDPARLVDRERDGHQGAEEQREGEKAGEGERRLPARQQPPHRRPASITRARNSRVRACSGALKIRSGGPSSRILPPSRKQTLSATSLQKLISWVARIIVIPVRASSRTRASTSETSCGSSALVISSSSIS